MFPSNSPNRVFVRSQRPGAVVAHIARHNQWLMYVIGLAIFTAAFLFMMSFLTAAMLRKPMFPEDLAVLPVVAFVILWYTLAFRVGMWRAFGVEDIVIENGLFSWTRTALFWKRRIELPASDISAIRPSTPWHDLSNRVEIVTRGRLYRIGDMLRRDETYVLADVLRRACRLPQ